MHDIIDSKSLTILHVSLRWESDFASHVETFFVPLNVWRELELLPNSLPQALAGQSAGFVFKTSFAAGSLVPAHEKARVRLFQQETFAQGRVAPRLGRFYPRGLLPGYAQNPQPFRCTAISDGGFSADFNHPLAKQPLELEITVAEVQKKRADTGGVCHDWLQVICDGPGMQVRQSQTSTDFFADDPYARADAQDDAHFYGKPRMVNHNDAQADTTISSLYGRLLKPGSRVLDLMSSWNSHLPESLELAQLTGLGLNREELTKNPRLTDNVVHDLNRNPVLPFGDQEFEAVVCTASVEYLTNPGEIFREVAGS
jgi:FKBP-type peptidyl-prolyl cis-trans isomerase 2